jgi:hypothetical protein
LPGQEYLPAWHTLRTDPAHAATFAARFPDESNRQNETSAAVKAQVHTATPAIIYSDALARAFLTVAQNRFQREGLIVEEQYATRVLLDIEGNQREDIDAKDRVIMRNDYDMLGTRIHQASMEAGEHWSLSDVTGKPIYAWDSRGHRFRTLYDPLRRPVESYLQEGGDLEPEVQIGRTTYGESLPQPEQKNLRGRVVELRDQAGLVSTDEYDFKGNLKTSSRQLARNYKTR